MNETIQGQVIASVEHITFEILEDEVLEAAMATITFSRVKGG